MTFPEIFEQFKSHSYIRRESWEENSFIQLRNTEPLIRFVTFEIGKSPYMISDDIGLSAEDLLAEDWIDIEDLMPKEQVKPKVKPTTFWDYVDTLKDGTDDWRYAMQLGQKYHNAGKNPDEYLDEIIKKVNKK